MHLLTYYATSYFHGELGWFANADSQKRYVKIRSSYFSYTLISVPLPPKIPSIIFETQEDEIIQELASTMDAGVRFSTVDHKYVDFNEWLLNQVCPSPSNPRENRRISDCGLRVRDGRIQGNLAVARAFGDFQYKKNEEKGQLEQAVSCLPDVHSFQRSIKVVLYL